MMLMMMMLHNATFNYVCLAELCNQFNFENFSFPKIKFCPHERVSRLPLSSFHTKVFGSASRPRVCGEHPLHSPLGILLLLQKVISLPKSLGKSFISSEMCSSF